jgi:hypothetical protein
MLHCPPFLYQQPESTGLIAISSGRAKRNWEYCRAMGIKVVAGGLFFPLYVNALTET